MAVLKRTDSDNIDFKRMVVLLDADLALRDGKDHAFYDQFNKINLIKFSLVAYENEKAIGCGAFKELEPGTVEVKRMYVMPRHRKKGIAGQILSALEEWAKELSYKRCVLETGKRQPEAIGLYKKYGYGLIPNYGPYAEIENSMCFEKILHQKT